MNYSFNFPLKIQKEIEDEYAAKKNKFNPSQQAAFSIFLDPNPEIEGDKEVLEKFLDDIPIDLKKDYIDLIENFDDLNAYRKFLGSILIYLRIENIGDECDKFLYLCIAIEAATRFKYNQNKKKTLLFQKFFKDNLPIEERIKIVSNFKSKDAKYTLDSTDLIRVRSNPNSKIKKIETNSFLPACYRLKKCYIDYDKCYPEYGCYLKDIDSTDGFIELPLNFLYQKRSIFVHDGRVFPHPNGQGGSQFVCHDPSIEKDIIVRYSLDLFDLIRMYQIALLNHFKQV
ncbi:hypothetical protein HYG87_06635 [Methanobacterium alkalithermotolerans]|uniref:Uncharacterized protein n=1 Tax=Methanobacterium alkalithermotolerans TaxID=2731220 RepID=A0A8T8K4I0_9EURY|nr:hypothetical protein [Methanobacterium alkalithermotolerans]QUH23458.1 hypothetical protein HYG87_06635 [Methanobacterium alkalithermotolerans]